MIELAGTRGRLKGVTDNTKISPEGMYYYSVKDPYIEVSKEEELDKKRSKQLSLTGVDNNGDGDFEAILMFAEKKAKDLAKEILDGNIDKNPLYEGQTAVCEYCPFSDCCRFDQRYGGNRYKFLKYKNTIKERPVICRKIKEELGIDKEVATNGELEGTQ